MGRRLAGGVLVALGLIAASLAWAAFSVTRTVLDPDRSQAIADEVYEDPEVRRELRSSVASGLLAALPDGVEVTRLEVEQAAERALENPAVEDLLVGGIVRAHQRLLGEGDDSDEPIVVDGAALASATRTQLVNQHPELLGVVPEVPSISVSLPTESIPDAGGLRSTLTGAVVFLSLVATGLVVAAFVVTNNRAKILRRVGFWAIGAAAFWVVVAVALPWLAHLLLPGQAAIVAAIWGVAAGGMIGPSITAAVLGAAAVLLSFAWMMGSSLVRWRRGVVASRPDPRREQLTTSGPAPAAPIATPLSRPARAAPHPPPASSPSAPSPPAGSRPAPTRVPGPATPPRGVPAASARREPPRWIEGVGYVDDEDTTRHG